LGASFPSPQRGEGGAPASQRASSALTATEARRVRGRGLRVLKLGAGLAVTLLIVQTPSVAAPNAATEYPTTYGDLSPGDEAMASPQEFCTFSQTFYLRADSPIFRGEDVLAVPARLNPPPTATVSRQRNGVVVSVHLSHDIKDATPAVAAEETFFLTIVMNDDDCSDPRHIIPVLSFTAKGLSVITKDGAVQFEYDPEQNR
jgi:hypothetical protein